MGIYATTSETKKTHPETPSCAQKVASGKFFTYPIKSHYKKTYKGTDDKKTCGTFEKAVRGSTPFIYLSKYTHMGVDKNKKPILKEVLNDAYSMPQGNVRGVHLSPKAEMMVYLQKLDEHNKPIIVDEKPVYIKAKTGFCETLWHELVGHAIEGYRTHPRKAWNDYRGRDNNVPNWGKVDPTLAIENLYREKMGLPLCRPQYYDNENPR